MGKSMVRKDGRKGIIKANDMGLYRRFEEMVLWNDMVEWNIGKLDTHSVGLWEKGSMEKGMGEPISIRSLEI